jgi:hypothetical protein
MDLYVYPPHISHLKNDFKWITDLNFNLKSLISDGSTINTGGLFFIPPPVWFNYNLNKLSYDNFKGALNVPSDLKFKQLHKGYLSNKGLDFFPKTVLSYKEISSLKFPIIVKPAYSQRANGIYICNSIKDIKHTHGVVYQEFKNFIKEWKVFYIKNKFIFFVGERTRVFLDFKSNIINDKWYNVASQTHTFPDFTSHILELQKYNEWDFQQWDFAQDTNGKIWVLECNITPGYIKGSYEALKIYAP